MRTATAVKPRQLEGRGLTKTYGRVTAVDDLSLSLHGGLVGLLGPNGAGKTTLLRMLATVLSPDAGSLRLLGLDPSSPQERVEIRRNLGYLPQSPTLYPHFSPLELVDYVAVLKEHTQRGRRQQEAVRVLTSVGLAGVMHRKIRTLSYGQRRRVALALGSTLALTIYPAPFPIPPYSLEVYFHRRHAGVPGHAWLRDQMRLALAAKP